MASTRILLAGIGAEGRHGANPGERLEPQPFVIDLDVLVEVERDDLDATIDYRAIADLARSTVASTSFDLLESVAGAVARALFDLAAVLEVTATVHKPRAAESLGVDDVAAEVTLEVG
jgi:dihydroneopterin aldolase